MSTVRKNTLVVDLSVLPTRPDAGKVEKFLEKKIKLQLKDTKNIQLHNIRNCVYIETVDYETAVRYEEANANRHIIVCNGKEFKIPVYVESDAVTVRVHDLPSHTQHLTVIDFMEQYGTVLSITRERWKRYFPGVYNGVRVLRMRLNRPIPSVVTIDGEQTLVTYHNQPTICNHCGEAGHSKSKCTKISRTTTKNGTPPHATPSQAGRPRLDEKEFPSLPAAPAEEPNVEQNKTQQNETSSKINTTDDKNDNGNDDHDDDDDDDDSNDDENGSSSLDNNGFTEAVNQKRRMSDRLLNRKAKEMKKQCLSQESKNSDESTNRFQALVGKALSDIDSACVSAVESKKDANRSRSKNNKNCNSST